MANGTRGGCFRKVSFAGCGSAWDVAKFLAKPASIGLVGLSLIHILKRNLGLPMYDAPNAVEELKQPRKHPTPEKVEAIKDALRYFAVI